MADPLPNLPAVSPQIPPSAEPKVSLWRWAFRFIRWSTYLATLLTILLLLHKSPAPQVVATPQAAASAEQKVSQVQQSVSQGQPATLRLDQTELNSYLANHLDLAQPATAPAASTTSTIPTTSDEHPGVPTAADIEQARSSVKDVKVTMEGDQVHAYVVFDMHGKDMTLDLVGKLGAAGGYLKFEPVSGRIGSLPIPQSALESAVKQLMESPENREKLKLPSDVSDLHIENGELVTTYH
ncbi:MAG TPA: hypothetical protein VJX70_11950 [Candidatus Acidoferrum sp.]|nr:hypothetical protein [Candidatus Acidoferrum sp.]